MSFAVGKAIFVSVAVHEAHEAFPMVVIFDVEAADDTPKFVAFLTPKNDAATGGGDGDFTFFIDEADDAIGTGGKTLETVEGI